MAKIRVKERLQQFRSQPRNERNLQDVGLEVRNEIYGFRVWLNATCDRVYENLFGNVCQRIECWRFKGPETSFVAFLGATASEYIISEGDHNLCYRFQSNANGAN